MNESELFKKKTYLIDKKCGHELSWLEHLHHLPDQIIVRCLGEVGFEANVGELRFRGDVDGPVSSLEKTELHYAFSLRWQRDEAAAQTERHSRQPSFHSLSIHKG